MNDLDKQKAERARKVLQENRYELVLFLQFVASGLIVIAMVAVLAWMLGWI